MVVMLAVLFANHNRDESNLRFSFLMNAYSLTAQPVRADPANRYAPAAHWQDGVKGDTGLARLAILFQYPLRKKTSTACAV